MGVDKLSYAEEAASPATGLVESKLIINSTISDANKNARFMSVDLKDHFLASPMRNPDFMKIHISKFPQDIIEQYNLREKMDSKEFVYIKIKKGMYGLKQASIFKCCLLKCVCPWGQKNTRPETMNLKQALIFKCCFMKCVCPWGQKNTRP